MLLYIYLSYTQKTKTVTDRTGLYRTITSAANPNHLVHWKQQMLCAHTWVAKNNVSNTWAVKGTLRCGASTRTQCDSSVLQNSDTNSKCKCAWSQTTRTSVRADCAIVPCWCAAQTVRFATETTTTGTAFERTFPWKVHDAHICKNIPRGGPGQYARCPAFQ